MRVKLFHKLFLIIAGTALLSALAMAAVLSLELSRGFENYLRARDAEQLDGFVESVAADIRTGRLTREELLSGEFARNGLPGGLRPPPPGAPPPGAPPPRGERPRRPPPEGFGARLILFNAEQQQVFGPPLPQGPAGPPLLKREIRVDGAVLGTAVMLPRAPAPAAVEQQFLQSQYHAAVVLTLGLLALAAVLAAWFARHGTKRIDRMAQVTRAVAQGDLAARLEVVGEDELADMGHNINAMSEGLVRLDTARRRWLAEISHELRTPLAALVGELDALKDDIRPLDKKAIYSLAQDAGRLTRIVQDLHFLAVSDLSGATCQLLPCDAVAIVRDVTSRFEEPLRAIGLVLKVDLGGMQRAPVCWDSQRIEQLLSILLTNSERYTDSPGTVQVRLAMRGTDVHLEVEDSAPSADPANLEKLFEPLFREHQARTRVADGNGLGLAVARAIVKAHDGTIAAVVSSLGGLAIRVVLPAGGRRQ